MLFILAQICGLIALVLTVVSVQFKTKEKIVMCFVFANLVVTIQFFFNECNYRSNYINYKYDQMYRVLLL